MNDKKRFCECGREIPAPRNSTIWSKLCPACTYAELKPKNNGMIPQENKTVLNRFKMAQTKNTKKSDKSKAMTNADTWFSRYIRLKHSISTNRGFVCRCITCGSLHVIKDIDCGHYVNRQHMEARYEEDNARPQCKKCNRFQSGRHSEFGINLSKQIGIKRIDELRQMSLFSFHAGGEVFFKEKAEEFKKKFKDLCKEREINSNWNNF